MGHARRKDERWRSSSGFSPACSRPATCTSAIISAPSRNSSRCRSATTASIAWSTCTPSRSGRIRRSCTKNTREVTAAFLACGIDPNKHIIFNQSQVHRARRACLGVQLRRPHRLAQPHDAVQGEGRQGPRERLGRPLCLSGPDGGRHPGLSRDARAGRRGPEAASRTGARHRAEIQQRFRRVDRRARLRRCILPASRSRSSRARRRA